MEGLELYGLYEAITECEDGKELDELFEAVFHVNWYDVVNDDLEVASKQVALLTDAGDEVITLDTDMRVALYENEDFREVKDVDTESLHFFLAGVDRWEERREVE